MLISEKQVMQLITIAHAHLANLHKAKAPSNYIDDIQDLLLDINECQSDDLIYIDTEECVNHKEQTKFCHRCGFGVYRNE